MLGNLLSSTRHKWSWDTCPCGPRRYSAIYCLLPFDEHTSNNYDDTGCHMGYDYILGHILVLSEFGFRDTSARTRGRYTRKKSDIEAS